MNQKIVLLDCDGIMADWISKALEIATKISGRQHLIEHFNDPMLENVIDDPNLLDAMWEEFDQPGYIESLEPFPEAFEGVDKIRSITNNIYCLTAPMKSKTWGYERTNWLQKHFGIDRKHVIITPAKYLVHGDVFVDDLPKNIVAWSNRNAGKALLFHNHLNRNYTELGKGIRVSGWAEVLEFVK